MTRDRVLKIINVTLPIFGIGSMVFYEVCDTSCSSLHGSLLGLDLKVIGILFMAALLALTLPPASRWAGSVSHLRTMLLSGALGGEVLLVRFQVVHAPTALSVWPSVRASLFCLPRTSRR